jgi:hypothetical protein
MQDVCPPQHRNDSIHLRCLHEACKLLGGEHHLAANLGVEVDLVEGWLNGIGQPPDWVFLRCTDLLLMSADRS